MVKFSCELFPPKTEEGKDDLIETVKQLSQLRPEFFSITCGAQGGDHIKTVEIIDLLLPETTIPLRPHITCIGSSKQELKERLNSYRSKGINQLVVLRGDKGNHTTSISNDFQFATDLIRFIRDEFGNAFHIAVGAYPEIHPEAKSAQHNLQNLKEKMEAGADLAITQFFFDASLYEKFVTACRHAGINMPIAPGVLPIRDWQQTEKFSRKCAATFPDALKQRFVACDASGQENCAIDFTTEFCESLLDSNAPLLHFYTLNNAGLIKTILSQLLT